MQQHRRSSMDIVRQLRSRLHNREEAGRAEQSPGVYILTTRNNYVNYVGFARNLRERIRFHLILGDIPFYRFATFPTRTVDEAQQLEFELIDQLEPRYNTIGGE